MNDYINEKRPLFSIVIPAYNREKVITRAIDSILKQTIDDYEIIVVDDGSSDNTEKVVKAYSTNKIKYILQENQGATSARNTGIVNSKGKYISFLDSDDEWMTNMLEKQLSCFENDKSVGLVYSNFMIAYPDGHLDNFSKQLGIEGNVYADILKQGYLAPTSVISVRTECFDKVGLFDKDLPASQDDDICFRLSKVYAIKYIPEVMAYLHTDTGNRISTNYSKVANGWWMLWCKHEDDLLSFCGPNITSSHFKDCAISFAYADNREMYNVAINKMKKYSGHLNIVQKILFFLMLNSKGIMKKVLHRILIAI